VNTDIQVFLLLSVNSSLSFQRHNLGLQLINALLVQFKSHDIQ